MCVRLHRHMRFHVLPRQISCTGEHKVHDCEECKDIQMCVHVCVAVKADDG